MVNKKANEEIQIQLALEKKLLGEILNLDTREKQLDIIVQVSRVDFTDRIFGEIAEAMSKILILERNKIDIVNLSGAAPDHAIIISDLCLGVISSAYINQTVKELKARTYHRRLIERTEAGLQNLRCSYYLSEIDSSKHTLIAELCALDYEKEAQFVNFENLEKQLIHNLNNEKMDCVDGYSWGIKTLDYATNGIQLSKLVVIGALKKAGKTRFVFHTIRELYNQNVPTAFLSLEVPEFDLYKLLKASYLGIEDGSLRSGALKYLTPEIQKKLSSIHFDQEKLMVECSNNLEIGEVIRRIKRYSKLGAKIIFIDFLQRIKYDYKNSVNELEFIAKQLADITRELNISLIVLCQLNNIAEREIPSVSHLKGSGGIAEAADTILVFDNVYRRTNDENAKNKMDVEITQRYGESGKLKIYADLGKCKFAEYSKK